MKKLVLLIFSTCFMLINSNSQPIELNFTAVDSAQWVQLDSIKVMNRTQGSDTILHWPDTSLLLYYVDIHEANQEHAHFQLHQNYPNPVVDQTHIKVCIPDNDQVVFQVTDLLGRPVHHMQSELDRGCHEFRFTPGNAKLYFLTVFWKGERQTIKILSSSTTDRDQCSFSYQGNASKNVQHKTATEIQNFTYTPGDKLLLIGYSDTLQSGIVDIPAGSESYIFQFAYNIPCPGTPTVEYEGQTYNTVQIMSQCWLKENLNVGAMINAPQLPADNNTIEKYCMGNYASYCNLVGGLYFWNELMNYTNQTGGQGICPDGWHVPSDMEWMILEGVADSEFPIGNMEWPQSGWRGNDAGGHLKQTGTEYWESPNTGATDVYGFTALPGGYYVQGDFWGPGYKGIFWSSESQGKYIRQMDWEQQMIKRQGGGYSLAISVRCVKD
jgi:uncharacterized protein (TIGR02145 family)